LYDQRERWAEQKRGATVYFGMVVLLALSLASAAPSDAEGAIADAFGDTSTYLPKDYNRVMKVAESLGESAVKPLARRIAAAEDSNQLFYLCHAAERIPHPGFFASLQIHLDHPAWLARSSCGSAFAATVAAFPEPDALDAVWKVMEKEENCTVKTAIATQLGRLPDRAIWTAFEQDLFHGSACERQAAMSALANYPESDPHVASAFVEILTDPTSSLLLKESAAHALIAAKWPGSREVLLSVIANDPGGNVRYFAIHALVHIGLPEDIEMLREVIRNDPYDGQGVWAVYARKAIKAIQARSDP